MLHLDSADLTMICVALRTRIYSLTNDSSCKEFFPEETGALICRLERLVSKLDDFIACKGENSEVFLVEMLNSIHYSLGHENREN